MAVYNHLEFRPPQNLERRAKRTFEATGYEIFYYAASVEDEMGKTLVTATLDRAQMWDCNAAAGSSSAYEFIGLPESAGGVNMISLRELPCPCHACARSHYASCPHMDVCGEVELRVMRLAEPADCPDILTVPLTEYTAKELKAFIGLRGGKVPSSITRKDNLIKYIVDNYSDYINLAPHVPPAPDNTE